MSISDIDDEIASHLLYADPQRMHAVFDRLQANGSGTAMLPGDYLEATIKTFDLVWRSR